MKSPLDSGPWLDYDEVDSTQTVAADLLIQGTPVGVVFAEEQRCGRGRFDRRWISRRGESLTMSMVFHEYADHPRPHIIGMSVACAAAAVLHCELQWPNDLIHGARKLGGVLTEMLTRHDGRRVPVVGIGVNLNQLEFPAEIRERAVSMRQISGRDQDSLETARRIVNRLDEMPEPTDWKSLAPVWALFDRTAGKVYRLQTGQSAIALSVGPEGELLCSVEGESASVMAADATFAASPLAPRGGIKLGQD